jgi:hypothetical protein
MFPPAISAVRVEREFGAAFGDGVRSREVWGSQLLREGRQSIAETEAVWSENQMEWEG